MSIVKQFCGFLERWEDGGKEEGLLLLKPHLLNPTSQEACAALTTVLHTIIASPLKLFSLGTLTSDSVVSFIHELTEYLPSSSLGSPPTLMVLSEYIVDAVWSVDSELEDAVNDGRASLNANENDTDVQMKKSDRKTEEDQVTLVSMVRRLLNLGVVDIGQCQERLDMALLVALGLVEDKAVVDRKEIRARTALFYKQNKFNLLREQTEGYTKLTTELSGSIGPSHDPSTGLPSESPGALQSRARLAWKKVLGLIGYFDLDPNRALDIVIDVFTAHITTHYSFFLELLRISPWCRRSMEQAQGLPQAGGDGSVANSLAQVNIKEPLLQGNAPESEGAGLQDSLEDPLGQIENPIIVEPSAPGKYDGRSFEDVLREAEGERVVESSANSPVCAQVIGFKFVYYQNSELKETTPRPLFMTAALMISEGLMTLEDLYPHLGPSDDDMEKVHQQYLDDLKKVAYAGQINALSAAAPLPKDDTTLQRSGRLPTEPSKPSSLAVRKLPTGPKRPAVQKIGIVAALLAIGTLRPAIALISKFPWVVDSHPEISDLLLRILQVSISPLFDAYFPRDQSYALQNSRPRARWSSSGPVDVSSPKPILTLWAPTPPSTMNSKFVFFYPPWTQRIPLCLGDEDTIYVMEPLVALLGMQIHRDLNFFCKLCQVARPQLLQKSPAPALHSLWFRMLRRHILPAISMVRAQSIIAVDVWNILKSYESAQRWQLYAEWGTSTYRNHPELELRRTEVSREVKSLLRRLSHENIDKYIMTVTKIAHSNPCILFSIIVNQVQAYDNMIPELIKALNKVTILPLDVLTFILVDAFSRPEKEHVKEDGISVTDWLSSLSTFSSSLFRAYSRLDLPSMVRYIMHQLRGSENKDIIILQDLISQMCGVHPLFDLSESQIVALRGGPILRTEAVASNHRGVMSTFTPRTADRFTSTLKTTGLMLPLLILLAQQRQSCIHTSRNNHLKSLGHLYDMSQAQLAQLIEALNANTNSQHYILQLPSISELFSKFGIEASICMLLYQPKLRMDFSQFQELSAKQEKEDALKSKLGKQAENSVGAIHNYTIPTTGSPWLPMLESLFNDIKLILPQRAHEFLGAPFYATFWQLTMYDLSHPSERHNEEYNRLRGILKSASDKLQRREATDADDMQRNKAQQLLNVFVTEAKTQIAHCTATHKRLETEKLHWFTSDQGSSKRVPVLATQIIKHCLQPRALLSQSDADFSAFVIQYLHSMGTPGFHTTAIYDKLLDDGITTTIFSCSEQEALNYGRFLMGVLTNLSKLHQSEEAWKKHNMRGENHLPGFQRSWTGKEKLEQSDILTWTDFKTLNKKWHKKLAGTLSQCLSSDEYIHIHNAIVILKEILDVFPVSSVNTATGNWIYTTVESCHANETRKDLQVLIASYKARLLSKKSVWSLPESLITEAKPTVVNSGKQSSSSSANLFANALRPETFDKVSSESNKTTTAANEHDSLHKDDPSLLKKEASMPREGPNQDALAAETLLSIESIPRPAKRVRSSEARDGGSAPMTSEGKSQNLEQSLDVRDAELDRSRTITNTNASHRMASQNNNDLQREGSVAPKAQQNGLIDTPTSYGRSIGAIDSLSDDPSAMPPPSAPSSTLSAQELRIAARQSMQQMRQMDVDRKSDKGIERRVTATASPTSDKLESSPRRRSGSPLPGTRNTSVDSQASGSDERPKPDRREDKSDRSKMQERRRDSEIKEDLGKSDRPEGGNRYAGLGDRDRESDRERVRERDQEKDRNPERAREKVRERERDRDRDRERERERDRGRRNWEKEKDLDHENDRDRSHRDPGDRSSHVSRKEHLSEYGGPRRGVSGDDDSLSKRRRLSDDEADRGSRRSTRHRDAKDSREDRHMRSRDNHADRDREVDKRSYRKDRDLRGDSDSERAPRSESLERSSDRNKAAPESSKRGVHNPPSAPRAMSTADSPTVRSTRVEPSAVPRENASRGWKHRDHALHHTEAPNAPNAHRLREPQSTPLSGGSLRSRIGEEANNDSAAAEEARADDGGRKRTFSDRMRNDKESSEISGEASPQAPKRRKGLIKERNRYGALEGIQKHLDSGDRQAGRSNPGRS